jgi:PLD-like domain
MFVPASQNGFSVKAYRGDAKTLLAFNLTKAKSKNLAGFTIACKPGRKKEYYIWNFLQFETPAGHAQVGSEKPWSTVNAPIQKFRWLHVPGSFHQGEKPFYGDYKYTVTPRYFDGNNKLKPLDKSLSVSLTIEVDGFTQKNLELGFTRGFVQSQAFYNRFGNNALFTPKGDSNIFFDTGGIAGTDNDGNKFTFKQEFEWSGFTARRKIFGILGDVLKNKDLFVDVFAYDLDEPDLMNGFLELAKQGRIRIILDKATLHHTVDNKEKEDLFEKEFKKVAKSHAAIMRGKYKRYAHDKCFIVYDKQKPVRVLTGATNFAVNGLYINANHVLIFNDEDVAALYAKVFNESWNDNVSVTFNASPYANRVFPFKAGKVPKMDISFSPHKETFALSNIKQIATRVKKEEKSVFFAVMGISNGTGDAFPALRNVHLNAKIFSMGISDAPGGISLYKPGSLKGILASGKATAALPPPFNKEQSIGSFHEIHHKFVICGFNGKSPTVWCGSSNLAGGGEQENGDNLLAIYDADIVTVFTIEAVALVDHFQFRDKYVTKTKTKKPKKMVLRSDDSWVPRYYDTTDLYSKDRELFC